MNTDKTFSHWLFLVVLSDKSIPDDDTVKRMAALYNKEIGWLTNMNSLEELETFVYERIHAAVVSAIQKLSATPPEGSADKKSAYSWWGMQLKETTDKWYDILQAQLYAANLAWRDYNKWLGEQDERKNS